MMAIVIGMLLANILRLPLAWQPGLRFCTSAVLRVGIMLLGIRLSLLSAGQFTLVALPFVLVAITAGLLTVGLIGRKMGLSRQLSGLIAVGTSICGCTAIVATAPLIDASESEVSYSVACITLFGLAAMFFYPLLAHFAFAGQPEMAGLFLGTSIHETAQVAGAGMMYEAQYDAPVALEIRDRYQAGAQSVHDRGDTAGRHSVRQETQRERHGQSELPGDGAVVHRRLRADVGVAHDR